MKRFILSALMLIFSLSISAQTSTESWYNFDPKTNDVMGVSSNRAYEELLKDREAKPVIVAIIDGGTDLSHEDLDAIIWVNEDEIPNNGIDDDNNGYIDDVHGWNFIGGENILPTMPIMKSLCYIWSAKNWY